MLTSDNELLGRFVHAKDQAALEQLIRNHSAMVMGVCHSMLWQTEDAEDAFQATFLLLSRKASRLLRHNSLGGWLHEVAVRICLKHRREICRNRNVEMADEIPAKTNEPWRTISVSHDLELLHRELARLPKSQRDAIVLVHLEGKSRSQAARVLDCTTAAVKGCLARGRKRLRQRLLRHGIIASSLLMPGTGSISATECISEPLINATLDQCQGLVPDDVVGTGTEIVNSLVQKDLAMATFGISKLGAASVFLAALGTMTLLASSASTPVKEQPKPTFVELVQEGEEQQANSIDVQSNANPPVVEGHLFLDEWQQLPGAAPPIGGAAGLGSDRVVLGQQLPDGAPGIGLGGGIGEEGGRFGVDSETSKPEGETWDEYTRRLHSLSYLTKQQYDLWLSGKPVKLTREYNVTEFRREQRTRNIGIDRTTGEKVGIKRVRPQTRTRMVTHPDGTVSQQNYTVEVPYFDYSEKAVKEAIEAGQYDAADIEIVKQDYTVAIPVRSTVTAEMDLPARGSLSDNAKFTGFKKQSARINDKKAANEKSRIDKRLELLSRVKPRQNDVDFDDLKPALFRKYRIGKAVKSDGHHGTIITHENGKRLREFLDINRDNKVDQWAYFKNGNEVYREIDLDFDGQVDQYQYLSGDKNRYGIDEDQDGIIDFWSEDNSKK